MAINLVVVVGFVGELDVPGKSMWDLLDFPVLPLELNSWLLLQLLEG